MASQFFFFPRSSSLCSCLCSCACVYMVTNPVALLQLNKIPSVYRVPRSTHARQRVYNDVFKKEIHSDVSYVSTPTVSFPETKNFSFHLSSFRKGTSGPLNWFPDEEAGWPWHPWPTVKRLLETQTTRTLCNGENDCKILHLLHLLLLCNCGTISGSVVHRHKWNH